MFPKLFDRSSYDSQLVKLYLRKVVLLFEKEYAIEKVNKKV